VELYKKGHNKWPVIHIGQELNTKKEDKIN